jgi:tetratricopeptide (TPR) repeat protein
MRRLLRAAAVLALLGVPASASFEDLGAGARAPGLGDAFTALADDAYAIHYNPAGLAQLDRPQFSAAYSRLYVGLSDGSDLGTSDLVYAHPLAHGRNGTLGFAWDRFALTGLYNEQTMAVSYGRRMWSGDDGSQLMGGLNLKMLSHSFSPGSEAANACDQGNCVGLGKDPALSGKTSKSAYGADLGLIYRFPRRFQAGLSILNANQPDVGFSGSDKVGRSINLGLAYRSLWLSLMGELKQHPAAAGGSSRDAVFAAERFFPTLDYGQFGVRGSLGWGLDSSGWRQMTVGGAYRINKIQFDYAFIIPVGGVAGQSGSHRVSMTYHFGAPTADEEISQDLLEQAKRLREHGPDYGYEYSQELKPQDLSDPRLAEVRRLIDERRYRLAKNALVAFAERQPLSPGLIRLSNRLELVAYYYSDLPEPKEKFDLTLVAGLRHVFYGEDRLAMLQTSYAHSQKPDDARLGHLLDDLEKALGLKATRLPPDHPRGFIDELLYQVEFANTRGDTARAEAQLNDVLALEPQSATGLERLGSLRYLQGRMPESIAAWESAEKVETRDRELESLRAYLKLARERAAGKALPGGGTPMIEVPVVPATAPETVVSTTAALSPATAPAPAPATKPAPAGDPRDVESLYQKGVEHYARGEYLQASAMFLHILQIDPDNDQARKALERIDRLRPKK